MTEFAKGLKLEVANRDQFKQYIFDNAHDPGTQMENWGNNQTPEAIYIDAYTEDEPSFYRTYDAHVNGVVTWNYWSEPLLEELLEEELLIQTDEYDVELVESQED